MNQKTKIVLSILGVIVIGAVTVAALEKLHVIDLVKPPVDATQPTEQELQQQKSAENKSKDTFLNKDTRTQAPASPQPGALEVTASQEGLTVVILTKIKNLASGTCSLTVHTSSKSITKTAALIYQPEFSSCAGFSIPVGETGTGHLDITVAVTDPNGETHTASTTSEVR